MDSLTQRITEGDAGLHPQATPHEGTLGRHVQEPEDAIRFPFERDRHRIIRSTAFRRLQGKTQVFVAGEGDYFRTRLTHTMEVAQIARTLARALRLNEDVAECVALAHDLGHPPFGHSGEEAIDQWMQEHGERFEHNLQSHRIVTLLEEHSSLYAGLNLNREVEEGLLKHETTHPELGTKLEPVLEARVTDLADELAYCSHDVDDGLAAGLFTMDTLMEVPLARQARDARAERQTLVSGALMHLLVQDVIDATADLTNPIGLSPAMRHAVNQLRAFLREKVHLHPRIRQKADEGAAIVGWLCRSYMESPDEKIHSLQARTHGTLLSAVKDYVAGMTDGFARLQATERGMQEGL